ncbi:DNA primase [Prauserella marina]|uniref:Bifunctional DNA primase/polymerase, N-terminal n=1 Tax=Prauserella marina TaxID=530584 RepID=A0A222VXI0_9PSEU|nr:bifunctional DNA primase/polymerase [Prauserella marina]ASR38383.1 DNA primase [Prauserella marina]PWV78392.1 bifunctional DNA primase/polymerase-like protein [Prauserella marina]SDC84977.1 Bifunctional DNA primase/polymerase, N-terminal [Prauserella marina]
MLDTELSESWRGAFRIELRAEAIGLAWRGWPVLPGTYPTTGDDTELAVGWIRPVPVHDDWQERLGAHPRQVAAWWTGRPYSLLVATGTMVDAIEVDDKLGRRAAKLLRATGHPAPIVAMPNGRWLFLTTSSDSVPTVLSEDENVQWHSTGSWIPLPPTPFEHGVVHWRVKPEIWGWRLPAASTVHEVLERALLNEHADEELAVQPVLAVGTSAA